MCTIYYSKDSMINRDDTVDIWVNAFVPEEEAKERVNSLNTSRTEDDLDDSVEYHYLLNDWSEPTFYQ